LCPWPYIFPSSSLHIYRTHLSSKNGASSIVLYHMESERGRFCLLGRRASGALPYPGRVPLPRACVCTAGTIACMYVCKNMSRRVAVVAAVVVYDQERLAYE
jgi:hypothetical protein